jgi:anti-sigma regulatory factor (Ser/Thr protein kinase)
MTRILIHSSELLWFLDLVLVQTADGVRAVALDRIRDVTFRQPPRSVHGQDALRPTLTLQLDGAGVQADGEARIGLMYLQKGVRWIPGYRIDLDGHGRARITLQATVLNELADFADATVHLVIGVPTFQFKDTPDPIGLQRTAMHLSRFFQTDPRGGSPSSLLAANFSNTLMTQVARMGEYRAGVDGPATGVAGAVWPESGVSEDLYIFTMRNLTLRKGERMLFTVSEITVPYEDVFSLELPVAPPPELHRHLNPQQQGELARLFAAPRVMHKVRLANQGQAPFTTAPALLFRDGNVLAQGLMTYAAPGASVDLTVPAMINRVLPRLAQRAEQAGFRLEVERDPHVMTAVVRVDVTAVEQILFNLVDNACKHAAPTAREPVIHLEVGAESRRFVHLRVRDHGPGLSTGAVRTLFEPFGKPADEAAGQAPGVGLGLALSRRLSRSLGGDLRWEPDVADGASFLLLIPAESIAG